jgi:hypothetical protein
MARSIRYCGPSTEIATTSGSAFARASSSLTPASSSPPKSSTSLPSASMPQQATRWFLGDRAGLRIAHGQARSSAPADDGQRRYRSRSRRPRPIRYT